MNIIMGETNARSLEEKYTVLRLDTFQIQGHVDPITSYCVIEDMSLQDLAKTEMWSDLHENLMINYGKRNWSYCEQAIEHLRGKWQGELDSFYDDLSSRINRLKDIDLAADWTPVINRADKGAGLAQPSVDQPA